MKPRRRSTRNRHYSQRYNNGSSTKAISAARDKCMVMARDALADGDKILAENYYQRAEHFTRTLLAKEEAAASYGSEQDQVVVGGNPVATSTAQMPEESENINTV